MYGYRKIFLVLLLLFVLLGCAVLTIGYTTGETTRAEMRLVSPEDLTVPAETAVVVWMEGAGWEIGRGFYLGERE